LADLQRVGDGQWKLRQVEGIKPFTSSDPDSERVWWQDAGVHQNLTFPVHPDPISGMHCWHQKVQVHKAGAEDRYADVYVDTNLSFQVYREWLKKNATCSWAQRFAAAALDPAPGQTGDRSLSPWN